MLSDIVGTMLKAVGIRAAIRRIVSWFEHHKDDIQTLLDEGVVIQLGFVGRGSFRLHLLATSWTKRGKERIDRTLDEAINGAELANSKHNPPLTPTIE